MPHNKFLKVLALFAILCTSLYSCDDMETEEDSSYSKILSDDSPFAVQPVEEDVPKESFKFPKVELQKITKLKKAGAYGYSEFYYYISSNFEAVNTYSEQGATEDFEIYGHTFQSGIEYETIIHSNKPRHFIETFILPRCEMDEVKNTISEVYPDLKMDCQDKENYCEFSLYGEHEVKKVWFQIFDESTKIGVTYRNKY